MGGETELFAGQQLGSEHDLTRVLAEVLDHVVHGFEDGLVAVLDVDRRGETVGAESFYDGNSFLDGGAEAGDEFGFGDAGDGVELRVALADVRGVPLRSSSTCAW